MYTRILVPLDGSHMAEQALPYVRLLSKNLHLPVHLLRTFGPLSVGVPDPTQDRYRLDVVTDLGIEATAYLKSIKASLGDLGLPISYSVREGKAVSEILREAEWEGTLIVMSTHGRSGPGRWIMGSVANEVAIKASTPVFLVRSLDQKNHTPLVTLNTVVVALDGSPEAERVLPHVVPLAKSLNLFVLLFRVTSNVTDYSPPEYWDETYIKLLEAADRDAEEYLGKIADRLHEQGLELVGKRVERGSPAKTIEEMVKNAPDVMVALASHAHSGYERWAMGSVADHLVRRSGDPVLIVPRHKVSATHEVQARHLMSGPARTILESATAGEAAVAMLEWDISCLPVVNAMGRLVGILTQTDFGLQPKLLGYKMLGHPATPKGLEEVAQSVRTKEVREVMRSPVATVEEDTPLSQLITLMLQNQINHLPVVRGPNIVGVVTRHDLLKLLVSPEASDRDKEPAAV